MSTPASAAPRRGALASLTSSRSLAPPRSWALPPTASRSSSTPPSPWAPSHLHPQPAGHQRAPVPRPLGIGDLTVGRPLGGLPQPRTRQLPAGGRTAIPLGQVLGRRARHRPTGGLADDARPLRAGA